MQLAWITGAKGLIGNYLVQTAPRFADDLTHQAAATNFKPR
jgi:hypothetical protein